MRIRRRLQTIPPPFRIGLIAGVALSLASGCSNSTTSHPLTGTLTASPASIFADGVAVTTLTVTVGRPDLAVALEVSGAGNTVTPSGRISPGGVFTASLASTVAELKTITATIGAGPAALKLTTTVTFTSPTPRQSRSTLIANPTTVTADGSSTSVLTVVVADDDGPLPDQTVALSASGSDNTLAEDAGETNALGVFTTTIASTKAETKTIVATVGGLQLTASVTFVAGPPASLTLAPASATLAATGTDQDLLTAIVSDASGNLASGAVVTFSSATMGDRFQPATRTTSAGGLATTGFTTTVAGAHTLTAAVAGLTATTTVTALPGAFSPGRSSIVANPATCTADGVSTTTLTVTGVDAEGNALTGTPVTLSASGLGNSWSATTGPLGPDGTFTAQLSSTVAQTETISAELSGASLSAMVTFVPGPPAKLSFVGEPGNSTAGVPISPAVSVALEDVSGNIVTGGSSTMISVSMGSNPGASTLTGTSTAVVVNGVAVFPGLSLNVAATGYTLTATAAVNGVSSATSMPFNVAPGPASQLAFVVEPQTAAAGTRLGDITVALEDAFGNIVTADSSSLVSVAIGSNPGGSKLTGTSSLTVSGGVAVFPGLSLNVAATGYTLTAAAAEYSLSATSASFNVVPGAKSQVVFEVQPASGAAGVAPGSVTVSLEDADGNLVTADSSTLVTIMIGANPGGSTLSGTASVTASGGSAVASGLSLNYVGTGYTLIASAPGYAALAISNPFNIVPGAPGNVVFTGQPQGAPAGSSLGSVGVALTDVEGNVIPDATALVTLSIGSNPGGGTLSGPVSTAAQSGTAGFTGLSINKSGSGYTLLASAPGYANATSSPFNITAGAAANLSLVSGNAQAAGIGDPFLRPLIVSVTDADGNPVAGVTVSWMATTPGTSVTTSSTSSANGQATALATAGSALGTETFLATAGSNGAPVMFTESCAAGFVVVSQSSVANHHCAIDTGGALWCWGNDGTDQLGVALAVGETAMRTQVGTATDWVAVSAGEDSTCGLEASGALSCWGDNEDGELGSATATSTTPTPTPVAGNWSSVSAGSGMTCGIQTNGTLWCWGEGTPGGTTGGPQQMGTATNWSSVSVGNEYACALQTDGTLWWWSDVSYLWIPYNGPPWGPAQLGTSSNWTSIAAGNSSQCGLQSPGTLWCWESLAWSDSQVPVQVGTATDWVAISTTWWDPCGLRSDGGSTTLWCWGPTRWGANGTANSTLESPAQVGTGTNWVSLGGGEESFCGIQSDFSLWCWGENESGELGSALGGEALSPIQVGLGTTWATAFPEGRSFAIDTSGNLWATGGGVSYAPQETFYQMTSDQVWLPGASCGGSCFIRADNTLWCLGHDTGAPLDAGSTNGVEGMYAIPGAGWTSVSTGLDSACAINAAGELYCWGDNTDGEFGNGSTSTTQVTSPSLVPGTWALVSVGADGVCAVATSGALYCWGDLEVSLGFSASTPTLVAPSVSWRSVSVGYEMIVGITESGALLSATQTTGAFAQVGTQTTWSSASAGFLSACGLQTNGTLWCWGDNRYGQLGTGDTSNESMPVQVGTATNWTGVLTSSLSESFFATQADGSLWAWGSNSGGGLGDGLLWSSVPARVP